MLAACVTETSDVSSLLSGNDGSSEECVDDDVDRLVSELDTDSILDGKTGTISNGTDFISANNDAPSSQTY